VSGLLHAQFSKRFAGIEIQADLRQPADGFSITVLFGPSGCGKTTVLRCLAGLERPERGRILFGDECWLDTQRSLCVAPQRRDIGFCFQQYALFPHLTVRENVAYGLAHRRSQTSSIDQMLQRFELSAVADRLPSKLSGGQQQRVAVARSLMRRPRLLLLDEPLSALDSALREALRPRLRQLLAEYEIPVVIVTHDRIEAISLADQIVVMLDGRVCQSGPVDQVFGRPRDAAVAKVVGVETVETGRVISVSQGIATVDIDSVCLRGPAPPDCGATVHVCISGEDVTLERQQRGVTSSRNRLAATVIALTNEGPLVRVMLACRNLPAGGPEAGGKPLQLTALITRPAREELGLTVGDAVTASVKAAAIHLIG